MQNRTVLVMYVQNNIHKKCTRMFAKEQNKNSQISDQPNFVYNWMFLVKMETTEFFEKKCFLKIIFYFKLNIL